MTEIYLLERKDVISLLVFYYLLGYGTQHMHITNYVRCAQLISFTKFIFKYIILC